MGDYKGMRKSNFNRGRIENEVERDTNLPKDWAQPIVLSGFYRNMQHSRYDVKITVAGVQRYVGTAYSHQSAAQLYDLALWRLCPKLGKLRRPNFPEAFQQITQEQIDNLVPGLNVLYRHLGYVNVGDENVGDDKLREQWFANLDRRFEEVRSAERNRTDHFANLLHYVKASEIRQRELLRRLQALRSKVPRLSILPSAVAGFNKLTDTLVTGISAHGEFGAALDTQKEYYEKEIAAEATLA